MSDDEALVRELAERGPYIVASDALSDACALCGKVDGQTTPLADPASHAPGARAISRRLTRRPCYSPCARYGVEHR